MTRRIVLLAPSRAYCGVCVTSTLWARGWWEWAMREREGGRETEVAWLTTYDDAPPSRRVGLDSLVVHPYLDPRYHAGASGDEMEALHEVFARPDYYAKGERVPRTCWGVVAPLLDALGPGDLVFVDWSASVLPVADVNAILAIAKKRGAVTVARVHSQLLQGLYPDVVDLFVAPFPKSEADALSDSEVKDVAEGHWLVVPHPTAPASDDAHAHALNEGPAKRPLVLGYGAAHRMPHDFVREAAHEAGCDYEVAGVQGEREVRGAWLSLADRVRDLARASVLVLFYAPIRGVGRSSALGVALGAQVPILTSDCAFLRDAEAWGGVTEEGELAERIAATVARRRGAESGGTRIPGYADWVANAQESWRMNHAPIGCVEAVAMAAFEPHLGSPPPARAHARGED